RAAAVARNRGRAARPPSAEKRSASATGGDSLEGDLPSDPPPAGERLMARKPDPRRLRRRPRPSAGRRPRARRCANFRTLWHALGHTRLLRTGRMPPPLRPRRVAAGVALALAGGLGLALAAGRRVEAPASPDPTPAGLPTPPAIPLEFADLPLEAALRGSLPPERRDELL